jgi:two-component system, response regulator YesN
MYHILIVDDEQMIRNGIAKVISWKKIGIESVFTAASGYEALEILTNQSIDLMITDINMTEMNGLELIEKAKELNPKLYIIVLTGYDSFEYAQKCCKLHVNDFLLKPVDEKELQSIVQRYIETISETQKQMERKKLENRTQGVLEQLKLEQAMRNLISDGKNYSAIKDLLEEYHYQTDTAAQIVVLRIKYEQENSWKQNQELLFLSVKYLLVNLVDAHMEGITFEDLQGNITIALFCGGNFDDSSLRLEKIRKIISDEYDVTIQMFVGSEVTSLEFLKDSYNEVIGLISDSRNELQGEILQSEKLRHKRRLFHEVYEQLKKTMLNNVGDFDVLTRAFRAFEDATKSYQLSQAVINRHCFELATMLYYEYANEAREIEDYKLERLLARLMQCDHEDACQVTYEFIYQLFAKEQSDEHEIVSKAKQYIMYHLSENLSVANIAERLYVTPNYFSRLFKKVSGEGCNEYIVRKRIQMAKNLLQTTNKKAGEIALLVGYRDTNYFSLAFKKNTGLSPTEYRAKCKEHIFKRN